LRREVESVRLALVSSPTEQIYDHNMISYPHLYIYIDFNRLRTSTTATVDDAYRIRAYILESFSIRM